MTKSRKSNIFVNSILHIAGLLLCVAPPAICTLCYFPLWIDRGSSTSIAGGAALLLVLCAVPLLKLLKKHFSSPSSYVFWLIAFVIFSLVSRVAYEMTVITFVGFISNLIGAIMFWIAKKYDPRAVEDERNE